MNLNAKVSWVPSLKLNPEEFHWLIIKLIIKPGLLLLSTKNGSDKFKVASWVEVDLANNGINKYILSSPIDSINLVISVILPSK